MSNNNVNKIIQYKFNNKRYSISNYKIISRLLIHSLALGFALKISSIVIKRSLRSLSYGMFYILVRVTAVTSWVRAMPNI